MCTKLRRNPPMPLTLPDWVQLYSNGASPRLLLDRYAGESARVRDDPVWIKRASADELVTQIAAIEARESVFESRLAAMRAMPLFGVPYAVKDNINVRNWSTTAACPAFAHIAESDAHAVARLTEAGAVCVGKTNLDQFATGLVGTRSPYGRPSSAFNAQYISGGSSSGSAVAVSRGEIPFALGTDTAGSGRVPSAFNNVVGLKPTPGRVSTSGVIPACRSLDCVSVFALTVEDATTVLALIEGDDPDDIYSAFAPRNAAWSDRLRIGVPSAHQLDAAYRAPWGRAMEQARALGHKIVPVDFAPLHQTSELLYGGPWVAERHAAVQALLERDPNAFDPTVRQIIQGALNFSATDAFRGQYELRTLQRQVASLDREVDVLMTPTAPGHPQFPEIDADPIGANTRLGTYTNFVNLLGWCALAVPAGFTHEGLPFGATFIAPANVDSALARLGGQWQRAAGLTMGATGVAYTASTMLRSPAAEATLPIAVAGPHLSGLPLNRQLLERGATLREASATAPHYRLFALPEMMPPKPGLVRVARGGASIAVEVWELPLRHVGSFLALIHAPLGLGSLELADGRCVHGFTCESHATEGATDITEFGGWLA